MPRLNNYEDMLLIYEYCRKVYQKDLCANEACDQLQGKVPFSKASLRMYFVIFSCMMMGKCYKMGTSESFTKFLIQKIYEEYGEKLVYNALSAAKQNSDYRIACGNDQPGIEKACREIIEEYGLKVKYEDLTSCIPVSDQSTPEIVVEPDGDLEITIRYNGIHFSAKGSFDKVLQQMRLFSSTVLPESQSVVERISQTAVQQGQEQNAESSAAVSSIGKKLKEQFHEVELLKTKMDFKAKMIPLMLFACESGMKTDFTIRDIQEMMSDALDEIVEKKSVENVFKKKKDWFEQISANPRRYKMLRIAEDYAKNVLADFS